MKLFRHSMIYLLSRGIPALLSIASLVVFTRLLDPSVYGLYILVAAAASLLDGLLMQWVYWALVRFSPGEEDPKAFEQSLINAFYGLLGAGAVAALIFYFIAGTNVPLPLIIAGYLYFASHSWYSLHLQTARAELLPMHFGRYEAFRSVLGFLGALTLILIGWGAFGLLLGLVAGRILPTLIFPKKRWWRLPGRGGRMMRQLLNFGLPLGLSTALAYVINVSDRLIIGAMMGQESAGLYGAGYDLVLRAMMALMSVLNLASYPLVVRALEEEGEESALSLLKNYFTLFVLLAGSMAMGLAMLSSDLVNLLLGEAYRAAAIRLIPIASLGVFLSGLRSFYFNYAFQLSKRTIDQIWVSLPAAILDIVLVLLWLPRFGIQGAIYASACAFGLALLLSILLGHRAFIMPIPFFDLLKLIGIIGGMAIIFAIMADFEGVWNLVLKALLAASTGFTLLLVLNPSEMRSPIMNVIRRIAKGERV
ncbi:oligosaccharide flippase family protein [bacterium]|nr:oligosaccharide flippase family protein [bacterium]